MRRVCEACGYVDDHNIDECPICKRNEFEDSDIYNLKKISDDESFIGAMINLKQKDPIEFQLKMSQFKATQTQTKTVEESNQVKCPKCSSTNIQIVPRKWSLLTGFLTNKTDRVCVNCKHKF